MGTPDFAVASLSKLVENNYNVVAVVTMPDKPVGRHHDTLQASPVKQYAVAHGIPVLQPERLKDEAFLEELRSYRADLQVVVAFRMLPEVVWAMPPLGTFNLHAALLPQYRGAAPINWAVINGETETGITTFFLDHDIDTGRIIHRVAVPIADTDTVGDVHDRLMVLGADLVQRTVDDIAAGTVETIDQGELMENGKWKMDNQSSHRPLIIQVFSTPLPSSHARIRRYSGISTPSRAPTTSSAASRPIPAPGRHCALPMARKRSLKCSLQRSRPPPHSP